MTTQDLAMLGYQPASPVSAPTPSGNIGTTIDPALLAMFSQQAPSMSLNPSAAPPSIDPKTLAMVMGAGAPSSSAAQQGGGITPEMLAAFAPSASASPPPAPTAQQLASLGVSSDPNGLTTGAGSPGQDPTAANAGNVGVSGNPATNPYTPGGPADSGSTAAPTQGAPQLTPWQQYLTERGIGPQSVVDTKTHQTLIEGFNAEQLKRLEMQDPEKQVKLQQEQADLAAQPAKIAAQQATANSDQSKADAVQLQKADALDKTEQQIQLLNQTKQEISDLASSKGLPGIVGGIKQYYTPVMMNSDEQDAAARLDQLKGKTMMTAIQMVRQAAADGGGAGGGIRPSQQEILGMQKGVARLSRAQSSDDMKAALTDLQAQIQQSIDHGLNTYARLPGADTTFIASGGTQFGKPNAQQVAASGGMGPVAPAAASSPTIKTFPQDQYTKDGRVIPAGTYQLLSNGRWSRVN